MEVLNKLVEQNNTLMEKVIELSTDAQADFAKAAQKGVATVLKEIEGKGVPATTIYNAMKN